MSNKKESTLDDYNRIYACLVAMDAANTDYNYNDVVQALINHARDIVEEMIRDLKR